MKFLSRHTFLLINVIDFGQLTQFLCVPQAAPRGQQVACANFKFAIRR